MMAQVLPEDIDYAAIAGGLRRLNKPRDHDPDCKACQYHRDQGLVSCPEHAVYTFYGIDLGRDSLSWPSPYSGDL